MTSTVHDGAGNPLETQDSEPKLQVANDKDRIVYDGVRMNVPLPNHVKLLCLSGLVVVVRWIPFAHGVSHSSSQSISHYISTNCNMLHPNMVGLAPILAGSALATSCNLPLGPLQPAW